jgi:hypothetical protein
MTNRNPLQPLVHHERNSGSVFYDVAQLDSCCRPENGWGTGGGWRVLEPRLEGVQILFKVPQEISFWCENVVENKSDECLGVMPDSRFSDGHWAK